MRPQSLRKKITAIITVSALAGTFFPVPNNDAAGLSTTDIKNAARKYLESGESIGTPVTLGYNKKFYLYVPVTVKGSLNGEFPGFMLNQKAKPVKDAKTLKELYRYPGLVNEFSDTIRGFDSLSQKKVSAIAQYCRILEVQQIKFDALNKFGNTAGVLYHATKLAFDAVAMVKSGVTGIGTLVKDLAKGAVQDSIVAYFLPTDSRAILEATQSAFDDSKRAHTACTAALEAWNLSRSTSGKASPIIAKYATEKVRNMFSAESQSIAHLRTALVRINKYPRVVTKIGQADYKKGMAGLDALIKRLDEERTYWSERYENANDLNSRELWTAEQIRRVTSKSSQCTNLTLSDNASLYRHSTDTAPCGTIQQSISGNSISVRCAQSSASWRTYFVKPINVAGKSKIRIKTDLQLIDHSRFFTECSGVGVKYDDYVNIMVLSSDPRSALAAECSIDAPHSAWGSCSIPTTSSAIIAQCGVQKCTATKSCDLEIVTAGLDTVYLAFHTSDAWLADIEGVMSGVSSCTI